MFEVSNVDVRSPAVAKAAAEAAAKISAIDGVDTSANPFVFPAGLSDPRAAALLGDQDRDSGRFLVVTTLDSGLDDDAAERVEAQVVQAYGALGDALGGATGAVGSGQLLFSEITDQIEVDLRTGEGIALPLSFALMVVVFGGFIAAGMPIAGAIASIGGGLAALYVFSYVIDLDAAVVNVVTLLGLALCIDYGLLVVSRAREELRAIAQGRPAEELTDDEIETAIGRTVGTAGRTVFFSGLTVAISLGGLLVFESQIMRAIGAAGMSVVLIALLVGVSLVPSLVQAGSPSVAAQGNRGRPRRGRVLPAGRSGCSVGRGRSPSPALRVLVVLALPTLSMHLTSSGHQLLPVGSSQRDFFDVLAEHYPALSDPAATVVAETSPAEATTWADTTVRAIPHVTSTSVRQLDPTHVAVSVRTDGQPLDDEARAVVDQLRSSRPSFPTLVGGQAAALADFVDALWARAPYAIAAVVIATFVLMFLMTGSVVLPVKALIINVLSLGASLGIATWVFQNGHFESLLGFTSTGALESMIPPLVLAFGFGLSMDYELFLLSRVAELYHAGVPNDACRRAGPAALRPDHHVGGPARRHRLRRVRRGQDAHHQADRPGARGGGHARRDHRADAAGARHHDHPRPLELVGADSPAPLARRPRPHRVARSRSGRHVGGILGKAAGVPRGGRYNCRDVEDRRFAGRDGRTTAARRRRRRPPCAAAR